MDKKYVSVSPSGVNNVECIKYYDNDDVLASTTYIKDLCVYP